MSDKITREEFKAALDPAEVRTLQVFQGAMGMGVVSFGVLILVLRFALPAGSDYDEADLDILQILSLAHGGILEARFPEGADHLA